MNADAVTTPETRVLRKTNAGKGRNVYILPGRSSMKQLAYARIILDKATPAVSWDTGGNEAGLICLSGQATIQVNGERFELEAKDSLYCPRGSTLEVSTHSSTDLAEFSAPVAKQRKVKFVPFSTVIGDPSLSFVTGAAGQTRRVNVLVGKNVAAGRLVLGYTVSEPGNYTSWPPHEHAKMLEEMYVFFDMPHPAFGIQMVYTNPENPELVTVVRDGDVVLIPDGYHPNVSVPHHRICFLWAMAAHREEEDRHYGIVNVQPEFFEGKTGLEACRQ